jgi:hypothetical protein
MKFFQILGAVVVSTVLAAAPSRAVTVTTTACFDASCPTSDHNLRFTGVTNQSEPDLNNLQLGSFRLSNSSLFGGHIFNGDTFDLTVAFGSPIGTATDVAGLTGFITILGGIVDINFSPVTFGSYVLSVNDVVLGTNLFHGRDTENFTGSLSMTAAARSPPPGR